MLLHHSFNPVQLSFPVVFRIVAAGGNDIERIPPGNIIFLILVAIVSNNAAIDLTDFSNQSPPLRFASVRLNQLTADAEHFAAAFLGDLSIMQNKGSIRAEPLRPFGLAGNILVEKVDMSPPSAVCAIDDRFQADLHL
ncbi:hypothetical protein D3C80_1607000 [compost metagenome]